MAETALAERPALPKDQLDLIKRTVANGATNDELALFLYDCDRRGIHPLDKLLHFTKRGGRYTPVTSIDFMRAQAAASGEMAGSDEPVFEEGDKHPLWATVTVYRLTQGQRFAYTATARWDEYCPDNAPMWRRMPHTMLGKCAEACALRKAFPQQLAGLYSREEMDQADGPKGYVVEAPQNHVGVAQDKSAGPVTRRMLANGSDGQGNEPEPLTSAGAVDETQPPTPDDGPDLYVDLPEGLRIVRVEHKPTANKNITKHIVVLSDGREVTTIKEQLATLADALCQERALVDVDTKSGKWGEDLTGLRRAESRDAIIRDDHSGPLTDADIPFAWLLPLVLPLLF